MKSLFFAVVALELLLSPVAQADLRGVWSRTIQVGGKVEFSGDSLGVDGEIILGPNAEKLPFAAERFSEAFFLVSHTLRSREVLASFGTQPGNSEEVLKFLNKVNQEVTEKSAYSAEAMELPPSHLPALDGFNPMLRYRIWRMSFNKVAENQWTCNAKMSTYEAEVVRREPDRIQDPALFVYLNGEGTTPGEAFAKAFPMRRR